MKGRFYKKMANEKKMLILDIDGTLVNSKKEITDATREYIIRIQEQGHIVGLASGRPYPGMVEYARQIKLHEFGGYALSFNGALVLNCKTEEVLYEKNVSYTYAKILYEYAVKNEIGLVTYKDDLVVTGTPIDSYMEYEARLNNLVLKRIDDFVGFVDYDVTKFLMTAPPDKAEICEAELKELLAPDVNVFRSEPYFIEATANGVDKALSIDFLINKLGIKRENTICCGDGFNDLTMVKYGGVGVAMDNAQQVVKDNADYITASCDNDGIVEVIRKFILY